MISNPRLIHLSACIETDIYLPAFPDMMAFFETSEEIIQNILGWNFIGICIACPFYGPPSDAFAHEYPTPFH
jgi:MFS transporter, DHA1 family, multidrug resistance protein